LRLEKEIQCCQKVALVNAIQPQLPKVDKIMSLLGKPESIDGSEVERYFLEGRIKEIADYCETDVVNTYRVWLRYELFRGRLSESEHQASGRCLAYFIASRALKAAAATRACPFSAN
jgi:predicted PolB exonuclease-like 3'-5' exonuclease